MSEHSVTLCNATVIVNHPATNREEIIGYAEEREDLRTTTHRYRNDWVAELPDGDIVAEFVDCCGDEEDEHGEKEKGKHDCLLFVWISGRLVFLSLDVYHSANETLHRGR